MENMLSSMLLDLIESNSQGMAAAWCQGIKESLYSMPCQHFSDTELERRARRVYENLGKWLDRDATAEKIGEACLAAGSQRCQEDSFALNFNLPAG